MDRPPRAAYFAYYGRQVVTIHRQTFYPIPSVCTPYSVQSIMSNPEQICSNMSWTRMMDTLELQLWSAGPICIPNTNLVISVPTDVLAPSITRPPTCTVLATDMFYLFIFLKFYTVSQIRQFYWKWLLRFPGIQGVNPFEVWWCLHVSLNCIISGSNNRLLPYCQLDIKDRTFIIFQSNFMHLNSRKCIWSVFCKMWTILLGLNV